jgi:cellulose biosynthesis protein BcsQ
MKIISIWSPKGGVGKTTLTAHIADCLATQHNKRVMVYDADPQRTFYHTYKGGKFNFTATDTMPEKTPDCDFFLVDFKPTIELSKAHKELLENSDKIIVPVRPSRLDLDSAKAVKKFAAPEKVINVLSCYDKRIRDQRDVKEVIADDYAIISYLSIYARTMNDFKTVYTRSVQSLYGTDRAKKEISIIAEKLL